MTRIEQLEKEIALVKELIALRAKLDVPTTIKNVVTTNVYPKATGGLIPNSFPGYPTNFGITEIPNFSVGYRLTLDKEKAGWPSSQDMWAGVDKPNYKEGSGPCKCN